MPPLLLGNKTQKLISNFRNSFRKNKNVFIVPINSNLLPQGYNGQEEREERKINLKIDNSGPILISSIYIIVIITNPKIFKNSFDLNE